MKRALFIDRDGTIIVEPPITFQVDTLEQMEFLPYVISSLKQLQDYGFEMVIATNQDGLGTKSNPLKSFNTIQRKMLKTLGGEGVKFSDILIDKSYEHENLPTRKPGIGMFDKYLAGGYDLASSYVIGDRITDAILAKNLGTKAILIGKKFNLTPDLESVVVLVTTDWRKISEVIRCEQRTAHISRTTRETSIEVSIDLDGGAKSRISTGIGFFDHMLMQLPHHAGISLSVKAKGDLHVDEHHTIEDIGIVVGEALGRALGQKLGAERYGYVLPMDECDAMVTLDFGGRIDFIWSAEFKREMVGEMPTEMFAHFFKSFAQGAKCNLHIEARGDNEHHKIEGIFKAFARAVKMAIKRDTFKYSLPSSKWVL